MAEGEGGSPGEGPGGAGGRGSRGPPPLPGRRSVRLPPLFRAGRARPCPRRAGRAAPEVSGRWRGPRADTPGRGRLARAALPLGRALGVAAGGRSRPGGPAEPSPQAGGQAGPQVLCPCPGARPRAHPGFPWSGARCRCCSLRALVPEPFCQAQVRFAELLECCCFA